MHTAQKLLIVISLIFLSAYHAKSMDDTKDKQFRGFMIDAPRGIEKMEYYFRLIDFCKDKEINAIIFRLTDDQGSAYLFTSHPELNIGRRCKPTENDKDFMWSFNIVANYTKHLSENPSDFIRILSEKN